ncbi:hypothetical protein KC480_06010 [Bacillus velezensis]|uniref:hypothetical protein n=1 Tax=Bacillus velezensis TaxID=492670 RepID=UPI001E385DAD|nr:hypothetical protein [Bacillus velezensis]MCD7911080.1 hypothetical protein [Bacillus velezensis]
MKTFDLLKLETIEDHPVFGLLKVETDKERIYIKELEKSIFVSSLINAFDGSYIDTEKYSFKDWDGQADKKEGEV